MLVGLVKWAYRRGELHERLRIKRLIAELRNETYDMNRDFRYAEESNETYRERQRHDMEVRNEAMRILNGLMTVGAAEWVAKSPAPIDKDEL